MGESKEEVKKFDVLIGKRISPNSIKTCDFQAIFIAQSAETLQEASVFLLVLAFQAFQSIDLT